MITVPLTVWIFDDSFATRHGQTEVQQGADSFFTSTPDGDTITVLVDGVSGNVTGNGFDSDAVTSVGYGAGDGYVRQLLSALDALGHPTRANVNYSISGATWSGGVIQYNDLIASGIRPPDVVIVGFGTNKAITKTFSPGDVNTFLDAVYANDPKFVIHYNTPSLNNNSTYNPAENGNDTSWQDETDTINAFIDALPQARPRMYVANCFAALGGHNTSVGDWDDAENVHPNATGYTKMVSVIQPAYIKALNEQGLDYIVLGNADILSGIYGSQSQDEFTLTSVNGGVLARNLIESIVDYEVMGMAIFGEAVTTTLQPSWAALAWDGVATNRPTSVIASYLQLQETGETIGTPGNPELIEMDADTGWGSGNDGFGKIIIPAQGAGVFLHLDYKGVGAGANTRIYKDDSDTDNDKFTQAGFLNSESAGSIDPFPVGASSGAANNVFYLLLREVQSGSPTLTSPYDARSDSLGDAVSIPSKFFGATSYAAQDLPDGCSINTSTGEITGIVKSLIAGVPTVIAKNELTPGVLAAIPWSVFDPRISAIAVAAGVVTFDDVTIVDDTAVYLSPFGLLTATANDGLIGVVDGSGSDLIINGITITSPAVLYLSPAGVLTDQPNGDPVANFN